jgi:RNA polymerase sigma factor (sigma-70 family)
MSGSRERKPLKGDEEALFAALAGEVRHVVSRIVNTDPATIEDACQFAWLQLLRCQPRRETVRAWLITVARNEAIRLHGIRRRHEPMSSGERQPGQHPEPASSIDTFALAIDLDEALTVLATLPERQRNLYALKVLGFSYDEIGRITGDSYFTVNRQLVRAVALIRRARASL